MPEFSQSLTIAAPPDEVLDFISDVRNLPKYLPTTKSAQSQGEERVRVQGEAHHHPYDADGYLRCDREAMRLEWGADEGYYSGSMEVDEGEDEETSEVTVQIVLRGKPPGAPEGEGPSEDDINEGLMKSLESIRNHLEGEGGKEEPRAAT